MRNRTPSTCHHCRLPPPHTESTTDCVRPVPSRRTIPRKPSTPADDGLYSPRNSQFDYEHCIVTYCSHICFLDFVTCILLYYSIVSFGTIASCDDLISLHNSVIFRNRRAEWLLMLTQPPLPSTSTSTFRLDPCKLISARSWALCF
jgi:hypothetical protein